MRFPRSGSGGWWRYSKALYRKGRDEPCALKPGMHGPNAPRVDTLEHMYSPVPSTFSVPSKLQHGWAFHGKSLPAVKSRSAPLTGQTVRLEGSGEPTPEGRCPWPHGLSPFRPGSWSSHPYRRAGGNGYCLVRTQRFWTVDLSRSHSDGRRSSPVAEGRIPWMYDSVGEVNFVGITPHQKPGFRGIYPTRRENGGDSA